MEPGEVFRAILLPIAIAIVMGTLGLSLVVDDFRRVVTRPRGVAIGLGNLLILSTLLAFGVATLFGLDPLLAVGLVLLGASPGGVMANLLTHLAKGETALSITMSAVSSVAAAVTVPLFLGLSVAYFGVGQTSIEVSMPAIVATVFAMTVVPLSVGMAFRARRPERAARIEPRMRRVALAAWALVVAGTVFLEWQRVADSFGGVAPAALTLNVAAMALGFGLARIARLTDPQATAISMELGIHNSALTIAVAASIATELAIPAAVYSAIMFFTAGAFGRLVHARNVRAAQLATA
jgi:BASS family bile acid:Na+ symporter